MKYFVLALFLTLGLGACSSRAGGDLLGGINSAPPDTGPGCYDHKNRLERTVTTPAECAALTWVWRTQ